MMKKIILTVAAVSFLGACASSATKPKNTDYWQRVETHSALYLTGPKAQQMLEENIATCVREIEELVHLGAIRTKLPEGQVENSTNLPKADEDAYWNVPQRFGYRYVDHSQYHDFDSCMRHKGWQRVSYSSYDAIALSDSTYRRLDNERRGYMTEEEAENAHSNKADFSQFND